MLLELGKGWTHAVMLSALCGGKKLTRLLHFHIPPTARSLICLSRETSDLFRRTCQLWVSQWEWFGFFPSLPCGRCSRDQMTVMHENGDSHHARFLCLLFGSLNRRTRQFPPTVKFSPFIWLICNLLISSIVDSNVATGGRRISILLVFQMPPLYPQCPLSPRMTKVHSTYKSLEV